MSETEDLISRLSPEQIEESITQLLRKHRESAHDMSIALTRVLEANLKVAGHRNHAMVIADLRTILIDNPPT